MPDTVLSLLHDLRAETPPPDWLQRVLLLQQHAAARIHSAHTMSVAAQRLAEAIDASAPPLAVDSFVPRLHRVAAHQLPDTLPPFETDISARLQATLTDSARARPYTRADALDDNLEAWFDALGVDDCTLVPLMVDGKLTGCLVIKGLPDIADTTHAVVLLQPLATALLAPASTATDDTVHAQGLQLLAFISDLITSATSEQSLLQAATEAIQRYAQVDHVGVVSIRETTGETFLVAEFPATAALGTQLPNDENSLTAIMQNTRAEIQIDDVANSPRITPELRQILVSVGSKSIALLPLLDAQRVLFGSFGLDVNRAHALPDESRMTYVRAVVAQVAAAVQRIRFELLNQRQVEQIQKINAFARLITADVGLERALAIVLEAVRALEPFDYVAVYLHDGGSQPLQRVALWRNQRSVILMHGEDMTTHTATPYHKAFADGSTVIIRDLPTEQQWVHPDAQGVRTLAVYPLVVQGGAFGVIEMGSKQAFAYTAATFDIFQQFANEAAVLLSSVMAYRQAQMQSAAKVRAAELATAIQQQTEMSTVVQTTLESLAAAFGARRARIRLGTDPIEKG